MKWVTGRLAAEVSILVGLKPRAPDRRCNSSPCPTREPDTLGCSAALPKDSFVDVLANFEAVHPTPNACPCGWPLLFNPLEGWFWVPRPACCAAPGGVLVNAIDF